MSNKPALVHIGITVSDMDRAIEFYETHFNFTLKRRGVFPPEFIAAVPQLYRQHEGAFSDFAFMAASNGVVLELFRFNEMLSAEEPLWNRPGYHHICIKVDSVREAYERMSAAGVQFYFEPKPLGEKPDAYWVFLTDPDGNMIELQDTEL